MESSFEPINETQTEHRLRLLESILGNASDAILVTEAEPFNLPGPRVVYINEAFTRMTGYTEADMFGKTPRILQNPETDRTQLDKIRWALEHWEPVQVEICNQRKNGEKFWVELHIVPVAGENGTYTHWISIQRETTVRRQAEDLMRENAERFRDSLVQNATDLAAILEPDGTIRYGSPSGSRILGSSADQWTGTDLFSRIHPDDAPAARTALATAIENRGIGDPPTAFRARHADGSWRTLQVAYMNRLNDPSVNGIVFNAWDITEQKRVDAALRLRDRAIADTYNGIFIADATQPDIPVVYMNAALERITGYCAEEVIGKNVRFLQGADRDQPELVTLRRAIIEGREWTGTLRNYRKDGTLFYNEMYISPVWDEAGRLCNFIGVQNDVTARRTLEAQLAHQAFNDALTGLPNRALFMNRLAQSLDAAAREQHTIGVIFLDLDRFKIINDSLGHVIGDQLLVAVGKRLQEVLRPGDTIARLGGDEFTLLLEGPVSVADAAGIAERICTVLEPPFVLNGQEIFTTASVGIALSQVGHEAPMNLLRDADIAMYRAKDKGVARYEVFDPSMNAYAVRRLELETRLRQAVEHNELTLHYQPVVSLASGEITGMEALVRWEYPGRGIIPPGEFIPLAEETGLILPIGHWVLEEACRQARRWQTSRAFPAFDRHFSVNINLSAKQFGQPNLIAEVAAILRETGVDPDGITLEITESVMMDNAESTAHTLHKLKELGVRLAMDDFGTGYSSLSYLKRFPMDVLKIDKSFVDGLGEDDDNIAIVRAIISLGQALGVALVAEGVETAGQIAVLQSLGCEVGQGFYFAQPLPLDAARVIVTRGAVGAGNHFVRG